MVTRAACSRATFHLPSHSLIRLAPLWPLRYGYFMHFTKGKTKFIAPIVAVVLAVGCMSSAAPADAVSLGDTAQRLKLYSPGTGESRVISLKATAPTPKSGGVTTQSIGPFGNTYCDTASPSFSLKAYHTVTGTNYYSGNTYFTCGNANGGFIHVRDRHAKDWIARYAAYGPTAGLDWSDIADFDISTTLGAPLSTSDAGGQKTCFGGLVQIWTEPNNELLFSYEPSVFVSQNNRRIVTAYPTTHEECSGIFG